MTHIRPAIIGSVPTLPPEVIVAGGVSRGTARLTSSLLELSDRVRETARRREEIERDIRGAMKLAEAEKQAAEGPVDQMQETIDAARDGLIKELGAVDDSVLSDRMRENILRRYRESSVRTIRTVAAREVGMARAATENLHRLEMGRIQQHQQTWQGAVSAVEGHVQALKSNVYGEQADEVVRQFAREAIEEELNVIISSSPKLATDFLEDDSLLEFITAKERNALKASAAGISRGELVAIRSQAEDHLQSGNIAALEALIPRIEQHADSTEKETTLVDVRSKITRFNNQASSAFRAATAGWTAIDNDDPSGYPRSVEARNTMWHKARDTEREEVLVDFAARHNQPFAPDMLRDIDRMFSIENPEFPLGLELLRTISRHDPDRARLLLQSKAIENATLAETMFDVTDPGRAAMPQDRAIEIMTRAGAPQALSADTAKEGFSRFPAALNRLDVRDENENIIRDSFAIRPDTEIPDEAMSRFNSFYRAHYADLSTRPAAAITDPVQLDARATRFALNAMSHDWTPAPRPGRGPIMVKAGLYGIGSNADLDVNRSTALLNFFTAVESDTGGAVTPEKPIRIEAETLVPVVSRDILAEGDDQVLAFAVVNPQTGERRVIKKGDKLFHQAIGVVQTGRPLNPLGRIKRQTNEPRSLSAADVANPLPSGKTRGGIVFRSTMDDWMRLFPQPPNFDDPIQREEFTDLMENNAIDIGFVDGLGLLDETTLEPTAQGTRPAREKALGVARPRTALV